MRRIYLESFVGLIILFMASLWGYEFLVYEINTDYDYLLQEHEGQAFHDLIYPIYKEHGLEYTQQQLEQFATSSHRLLVPHTLEELPTDIKKAFESDTSVNVAYDEERDIWFRLDASTPIFKMSDNPNSPVVKAANFDDNIVWLFFLAG
ncbi:two-component sensor histidine kinase, partial [Vibrio parahaemolyticus]|nr:two-component sensor histidine kinase [Vibrio parahaemolyticus]